MGRKGLLLFLIFVYYHGDGGIIEKLSGKTIQAAHINPIYEVIITRNSAHIVSNMSYATSSNLSYLQLKQGPRIWIENMKWHIEDGYEYILDNLDDSMDMVEQGEKILNLYNSRILV